MNKRCNERVKNVNFEKLRKCLKKHGITQKELSIVYCSNMLIATRKYQLKKGRI